MISTALFLDIDGVLNRCGESGQGLESDKVVILKEILDATGCKVILSSSWRKEEHQRLRIHRMLNDIGHQLEGMTPVLDVQSSGAWGPSIWISPGKSVEIGTWLSNLAAAVRPSRFVILDDEGNMGDLQPFLVQTDSYTGLTHDHAREVIDRLNKPESL